MKFLSCTPSVFVIGNEYEILVNTLENGITYVEIGSEKFYEENSGVLSSEKNRAKIRVPQSVLDGAEKYTVVFRKTINRKSYHSEFEESEKSEFAFKALKKSDNINIYHVADVHYRFDIAQSTASYFGEDTDLFVVNGDIGEVESEKNYLEVCKFVGDISEGRIPVIFVRGNHDTRGKLAERFTDVFPSVGKNTYFQFEIGPLYGVALDCGEDKLDDHPEYGGANVFELFRRRESEFLKSLSARSDKLTFAVSHICPAQPTHNAGGVFDIDGDVYEDWNRELARLDVKFMLCGHMHRAYVLEKNSPKSLRPHEYPVVVGSACYKDPDIWGCAVTVSGSKLYVKFTDSKKAVRESCVIDLENGRII